MSATPVPGQAPADSREVGRAEATRARLVEAATEAFAELGYHATTTRDIASRAGMSPAALYVHHASKEELLYEIARMGHRVVLEVMSTTAGIEDPVEQLRATVEVFVGFHADQHLSARVINYELAALTAEHLAEITVARREIENTFRRIVQRGMDAGVFSVTEAFMPALAITSLGIDVARWYRSGGLGVDRLASEYATMALRIVGAR